MDRSLQSAEPEVPAEVRRRLEERFADATWRIKVCAEPDGENCTTGTGRVFHGCAASRRYQRGEGEPPRVAWILAAPARDH